MSATTGTNLVYESCNDGVITFTRSGDNSDPLTITWTLDPSSTATPGVDYTALPNSITIPAGENSVTIDLNVVNDLIAEGIETIILNIDNSCSCSTSMLEIQIADPPELEATLADEDICEGQTVTLSPDVTAELDVTDYDWSPSGSGPSIDVNPTTTTTYTVTVTDQCGGTDTASATVNVIPIATAEISGGGTLCEGSDETIDLSITFTGDAPWTFTYTIDGVPQPPITTSDNPYILTVDEIGTYELDLVDSGGCPGTVSGSAEVTETELSPTATSEPATCSQENGSIDLTPAGGMAPYSFEWSNGETSEDLDDVPPGTYTVSVTDAGGCSGTLSVTVDDQPNEPTVTSNTTPSECGFANGDIDISVTGGEPPYTFEWSNGETTEDLDDVEAGSYTVTVTGADGCTQVHTVTLSNENPPISVTADIEPKTTCPPAANDGSISISISPPNAPGNGVYDITWSNGGSGTSQQDLPPGSYAVTVTAGGECSQTASFTVPDQPNEPTISATPSPSECGLANGDIDITVSGGVPPFTYLWSDGSTDEDLSDVEPGSYSVSVTGANGCSAETTVTLPNDNPPITVTADFEPNTVCPPAANDGSISISISPPNAPGNGVYDITWSNGGSGLSQQDLPPGGYSVTVSAGGECSQIASFDVPDQPDVPSITPDVTPSLCGLENGSAAVSISGGVPPYTIQWSNGQTGTPINGIGSGTYSVTVTGANGCSTASAITVPDDNFTISITPNISPNTSCLPPGNGSISISISPAQPPAPLTGYDITWSNGGSGLSQSDLPAGGYSVTVSAGGECSQTANFNVPDQPILPVLSLSALPATCGESNGEASVSVSGGEPPFVFQWSSGQNTSTISNVPGGSYTVIVTGTNGCSTVGPVNVPDNPVPITISQSILPNTTCPPEPSNGSITLSVSPPDASITWSNGMTGPVITGLPPGSYSVLVDAGGNCSETAIFTVPDNSELPSLSTTPTPSTCGDSDGSAMLFVNGGLPPFTFLWSNGDSNQNLNNVPAGTYSVIVTSAAGCTALTTVTIPNQDIPFDVSGFPTGNSSCATPNGSVQLSVTPTGNYTYLWSNGETTPYLLDLPAGSYTVTVSAGGSCTQVANFTVFDFAFPPNLSTSTTPATCGQQNGSVNLTVSGNSPPFSFHWSNGSDTEDLSNVPPGSYAVTVTDANGCTATASANVASNNIPINLTGVPTANSSCVAPNGNIDLTALPTGVYAFIWSNGETTEDLNSIGSGVYSVTVSLGGNCSSTASFSVPNATSQPSISEVVTPAVCSEPTGALDLSVTGATPPYSYLWSNGSTDEDLTDLPLGNYTVTVSGVNGCSSSETFNVPNNSSTFTLSGTPSPVDICTFANGEINLTITPTNSYDILWSNGETTEDLDSLAAGSYTVTVTESGSCSAEATFVIADATSFPSLMQTVTAELCGQENGAIDLTVGGTSTPYLFGWSNGETTEDLSDLPSGIYLVTVTGANGCTATTSANVPDNSISFDLIGAPVANTSCDVNNGSIDLSVTPAGSYIFVWSNGETTEDLSNLAGGGYSVTVSAGGECTSVANFTVPSTTADPVLSQALTPSICGENNGAINLSVTAGVGPFSFVWSNGETTEDLSGILAGPYSVSVTGSNGCQAIASYNVSNNAIVLNITGQTAATTSCSQANGSIDVNVSPAGVYDFVWSNGGTTEDLSDLPPGNYSVTVFEGATCQAQADFAVGNATNAPDLSQAVTAAMCSQPTGSIDLTATGGTAPYGFVWSNGETTEDLSDLPPGPYTVTVTGGDGCSNTGNYTVPNTTPNIQISGTASPNTACIAAGGTGNGGVDISVSPQVPPVGLGYSFVWSNGATTPDLSGLDPGSYTVTVSEGGNCSATATFAVGNNAPTVLLDGSDTDILCFGEMTGAIDLTVSGGEEPYQFDWLPAIASLGNLAAGPYAVTVTDASGCTGAMSFDISQPASALTVSCAQTASVSMPGAADGSGGVNISGGTGPYTVTWSPGASQTGVTAGVFSIGNLAEGQYDVTVVDANGCETLCGFDITAVTCETAVGSMSNALLDLCGDGCLTANYDALGQYLDADDVLEFILHTGSGGVIVGEIARSDEPTFCFDPASMQWGQTYYISAAAGNDDGTGSVDLGDLCTVVSIGTPIVFNPQPVAGSNQPQPLTCLVAEVPLNGTSTVPGSSFAWVTSGGLILGNANAAAIQAGAAGGYTLTVTAPGGCTDELSVAVTDLSMDVQVSIVASPNEILDCTVSAITLMGTASGGTGLGYQWSVGGMGISTAPQITVTEGGVYQLIAFDPASGCADTTSLTIQDNTDFPPLFADPAPFIDCLNTVGTLSGGSPVPGVAFVWATISGTDTTLIGSGPSVAVTEPGTYWLIGTAPNDCQNGMAVVVAGDLAAPSANAGDDQGLDCFQNEIELTGSSNAVGVVFAWTVDNPAVVISNPNFPNITVSQPGTYTLTVTQPGNGCTALDEVVVDLYENVPQGLLDLDPPSCFGDGDGSITVETDPVNGPYLYELDGVSNGNLNYFAPLESGTYLLSVTDGQGCTWATEVYLPEPLPLQVELGANLIVELGDEVTLQAQYTVPSSQLDTILWEPAELLPCPQMPCDVQEFSPVQQTAIFVTVIDTNGCKDQDVVMLFVRKEQSVYIPNAFSPNGDGTNDLFMIYSGEDVVKVNQFLVFSRWGETVFEYYHFEPNNPAYGWDGKHRGEPLDPAVFAWFAEIEFADGTVELFEGDVTLVR